MGLNQSTQRQNHQQQNYQARNPDRFHYINTADNVDRSKKQLPTNNKDIAKDIVNSKDYFYYVVALKDKNNNPIEGYDLMIVVDKEHKIQLTKVMSKKDYKTMTDNKNFKSAIKSASKKKGGFNCPPCNCNVQQQQQIQYENNSTFGQSAMSGFGLGVGFIGAAVVASLFLPSFNYVGYGYYDHFGGYGNYTEINNITNIYEDNDTYIEDNDVIGDNNDVGNNDIGDNADYGDYGDYGDMGDMGFGGKKIVKRHVKKYIRKSKGKGK